MGILRKKMNGASAEETVADIRGLVASGVKGSAFATSQENKEETYSNNTDSRSSNTSANPPSKDDSDSRSNRAAVIPFRNNSIDNGSGTSTLSLSASSGPVTDL